jgi:hypothetical protein
MFFSPGRMRSARWRGCTALPAAFLLLTACNAALGQAAPDEAGNQTSSTNYNFANSAQQYFVSTLSPENLISSVAGSATSAAFHTALHDFSTDEFQRRVAENLTRKGIAGSIQFVTASLLRQDMRFVPSGYHGLRPRVRYAFVQTFLARGRDGTEELAVPRIAASFGTAWVLETWHPWMRKEPTLFSHAGCIFGSYAARSFWTEFKPEIKHEVRTLLRR